ncbi:ATP-binding protein [Pseudomonas sp. Irchel s3h9]|uniref:ATP-binding protein n=1 Tax=Pseudomonas sp. Irchel s3h9 TaxID=2009192 RepID=UPI000BA49943|nr:ATP-binding protein [Pseudomonas sp. Irchel s3h9]
MSSIASDIDTVRASRAGHAFHERWAARRALQLIFPNDALFAIAVEGISSTETASPGKQAEEVADLVLYYGSGDNFQTCERLETVQFKYKIREDAVTAAYLKKTIEKFCDTILGYEKEFSGCDVDRKVSFVFVTNSEFTENLWEAIAALIKGTTPSDSNSAVQARNLRKWCANRGLTDVSRLFSRIVFRAGEKSLAGQDNLLKRTLTDWSAGSDSDARLRLYGLQDLVLKKAGPSGQGKNLIRREDILDSLDCEPEDLFPAAPRFIDVGAIVERAELFMASNLIKTSELPVVVHAEGGVGKTVFARSLAERMENEFEVVVFDCFGGGSYRSDNQARHLPRIGLVQIVNELASRTLCDPMLPGGNDSIKITKSACKRFAQAAAAIRDQSKKLGLLIIIDASDNAQLEADYRHEDSFPKRLLSAMNEERIDGVKLLLTSRTHRKDTVIGRSKVDEIELGPFTDSEAREFLDVRKPNASGVEIATALTRSGRNARVLDYLVQTWGVNVVCDVSAALISVPEIIAQRCTKIFSELHIAGWSDTDVIEFFVALSLLPPPIPLEELANALGWSVVQVSTAASDLTPMLEISLHGAIFRDEPTETFIRETYSSRLEAQRAIADRLLSSQSTSAYAAEALPHFLVVIKDSDRAFALADSTSFPTTVQSEFGRRRLTLARLHAAFRLAVVQDDLDRVLGLSMRLGQVETANMRGDGFILSSPALAIVLGDPDSYRRLAADRSGWRGGRGSRLTVAHLIAGNIEEAQIQCESTVRWIKWYNAQPRDDANRDLPGPSIDDYAAVLFQRVADNQFHLVDSNLANWNTRFSLSVSDELLRLLELYDLANGTTIFADFSSFAASRECTSRTLKLQFLSRSHLLSRLHVKALARLIATSAAPEGDEERDFSTEPKGSHSDTNAALIALLYSSRAAALAIISNAPISRPSSYDYSERFGHSNAWGAILWACVRAWSAGRRVACHDLLPQNVKITNQAKAAVNQTDLLKFLKGLREPAANGSSKKGGSKQQKAKFSDRECEDICKGILLACELTSPIEDAILSRKCLSGSTFSHLLGAWRKHTRSNIHWRAETAADSLVRTVGLGCAHIILAHAQEISTEEITTLLSLISSGSFTVQQKINVLAQMAQRSSLHELAGKFAQHVADQIRQDDDIGQRGISHVKLAASIIRMSIDEAREYYRQGLAELDQFGGESYDQIYSLLHFASVQQGGFLKPELGQRLMNLCQTLIRNEPRKFGWTLFARAAAQSIGFPAIAKLVRWHDQDVADLSYGLPQLACFLAKNGHLDPRRAAYIFTICEDHGWWDWRTGEGVADLLKLSGTKDQRRIFQAVIKKLINEYPFGGWPSLWESFLETGDQYPNVVTVEEREQIELLRTYAKRKQDEFNARGNSSPEILSDQIMKIPSEEEIENLIAKLVYECDSSSSASIDNTLKAISSDNRLPFGARERFIIGLRTTCPYASRLAFLIAVCDAAEIGFTRSLEILVECFTVWISSSKHLLSDAKKLVERLFESKSSELFEDQFSDIARDIRKLSDFCSDKRFVLQLVLRKVAADGVDLDGDDWLQLATALCEVTVDHAGLNALERLLSGPTARIADEIGEGPLRPEQAIVAGEEEILSDVIWHLLGNEDGYVRWKVARSLNTLFELGLNDELSRLLDGFDQRAIAALGSTERCLSFQNSQQWLLMGLARAALHHGQAMQFVKPNLDALAKRNNLHVIDKVHIARCLANINIEGARDADLEALLVEINQPPHGIITTDVYPPAASTVSDFSFGYEFTKHEIRDLAALFNLAQATVEDAIADEITRLWPDATSMDYFPGHERYDWDRGDRFEYYREHVQRHALLNVATNFSKALPVVVRSYETEVVSPWLKWRDRYDVTFDDGSWLSDRKDPVPLQAKEDLLGKRIGQQEVLQSQATIMQKLGFVESISNGLFPLYGRWSSPDGVTVTITSALTERKGSLGRCMAFAKRSSHDLWLPEFWDDGYYDHRRRLENPFAPLVWVPEIYSLGIDEGDEIAARGAGGRPRLGVELTKTLALINEPHSGEWQTTDGCVALRSQVWGKWAPDPDQRQFHHHDDGEILWACSDWLASTLSSLHLRLVFTVTLRKYKSSRSYDTSTGVTSVLVGIRNEEGALRLWEAKEASKQNY